MTTQPQTPLVIEPGKFYRLRNGQKYRCHSNDCYGVYSINGEQLTQKGWVAFLLTKEGKNYFGSNGKDPLDIIAPWVDKPEVKWSALPAWHNWVAMDENKIWYSYEDKPLNDTNRWRIGHKGGALDIHPDYAPKNYTGTWQDSLVCRPGMEGEKV